MNKTDIEYLDYTWNPIAMRCTPVSEGCAHCWHLKTCDRLKNNPKFPMRVREAYAGDREPFLVESRLGDPIKRKKPSIIGVQFMGDLFHSDVKIQQMGLVLRTIARSPQHKFLLLTKRPTIMKNFFELCINEGIIPTIPPWIWLGVTAENQQRADERIPILLDIPAKVRFVSIEPMLSAINLAELCPHENCQCNGDMNCSQRGLNSLTGELRYYNDESGEPCSYWGNSIDWVICGCESGKNRRHVSTRWIRDIKNQCVSAGVPFFLKQMEVEGKIVKMPMFDGYVWDKYPEG